MVARGGFAPLVRGTLQLPDVLFFTPAGWTTVGPHHRGAVPQVAGMTSGGSLPQRSHRPPRSSQALQAPPPATCVCGVTRAAGGGRGEGGGGVHRTDRTTCRNRWHASCHSCKIGAVRLRIIAMPKYRVTVADRNTGAENFVIVRAETARDAETIMCSRGYMVGRIESVSSGRSLWITLGVVVGVAGIALCAAFIASRNRDVDSSRRRSPASANAAALLPNALLPCTSLATKDYNKVRDRYTTRQVAAPSRQDPCHHLRRGGEGGAGLAMIVYGAWGG